MAKDTRKAFRGIVVAEGHYDHSVSFDTRAELEAYGDGVSTGAGLYGCGSCYLLTADELDDDYWIEHDRIEPYSVERFDVIPNSKTPTEDQQ